MIMAIVDREDGIEEPSRAPSPEPSLELPPMPSFFNISTVARASLNVSWFIAKNGAKSAFSLLGIVSRLKQFTNNL
jgi:hypothetical protein